jgi:two-component system OmpR family response regulator/two-component system response regulator RstA
MRAQTATTQRRIGIDTDASRIVAGNLCIDVGEVQAFIGGQRLPVTLQEFEVLVLLANTAGTPVSQDVLCHKLWGESTPARRRHLSVLIARLRAKLAGVSTHHLLTIRKRGYGLVEAPVHAD